jgi:purine-nucleoside phosphorylase
MANDTEGAIEALRKHGLHELAPLGVVLGSGLGSLADEVEGATAIAYQDLPGFPVPTVSGHAGRLVVGRLEGRRVALFQGRGHYYERGDASAMAVAIETFRRLGGHTLFLTNAAGRGMAPAGAGLDHGPYQFRGRQSADRPPFRRPFRAAHQRL